MGIFSLGKVQPQFKGKVVALLNQKGGVGKTTLAFNLAHALAEKGQKVLCIDMDPQANLSLLFGVDQPSHSIFHLLVNSIRELKSLHTPVLPTEVICKNNKVDLIPACQLLSGFELTVAGLNVPRQLLLKKFIEKNGLLGVYDSIVIDGPPTLGLLVVNILCASHGILIPFQPDSFSRNGLKFLHQVLGDIEEMEITQTPKILGYIPNLVESRRKQSQVDFAHIADDLEKQSIGLKEKILEPFPNRVHLSMSSAQNKSVFDFQAKEYLELQGKFLALANKVEEGLYEQ